MRNLNNIFTSCIGTHFVPAHTAAVVAVALVLAVVRVENVSPYMTYLPIIRPKQLSMTAIVRLIWFRACVVHFVPFSYFKMTEPHFTSEKVLQAPYILTPNTEVLSKLGKNQGNEERKWADFFLFLGSRFQASLASSSLALSPGLFCSNK